MHPHMHNLKSTLRAGEFLYAGFVSFHFVFTEQLSLGDLAVEIFKKKQKNKTMSGSFLLVLSSFSVL